MIIFIGCQIHKYQGTIEVIQFILYHQFKFPVNSFPQETTSLDSHVAWQLREPSMTSEGLNWSPGFPSHMNLGKFLNFSVLQFSHQYVWNTQSLAHTECSVAITSYFITFLYYPIFQECSVLPKKSKGFCFVLLSLVIVRIHFLYQQSKIYRTPFANNNSELGTKNKPNANNYKIRLKWLFESAGEISLKYGEKIGEIHI